MTKINVNLRLGKEKTYENFYQENAPIYKKLNEFLRSENNRKLAFDWLKRKSAYESNRQNFPKSNGRFTVVKSCLVTLALYGGSQHTKNGLKFRPEWMRAALRESVN